MKASPDLLGVLVSLFSACLALPWTPTTIQLQEAQGLVTGSQNISRVNLTTSVQVPPAHPVKCLEPGIIELEVAIAADCDLIINDFILRLDNPMRVQTFGYNGDADVDMRIRQNRSWHFGQCLIYIDSLSKAAEDQFRLVDIAIVAQRIIQECVIGSKNAFGGYADIGASENGFFVIVGGVSPDSEERVGRHTQLSLPLNMTSKRSDIPTEGVSESDYTLHVRSNNTKDLIVSDTSTIQNLPITCIKPGMPAAAGGINPNDCSAAAKAILTKPEILIPQDFTTEATGGIHVPDVYQSNNCFLTINTHSPLSKSEMFSYIKVVYYASEIMRKCMLGGVVKLTPGEGGFYLSLTGLDPITMVNELGGLLNSSSPALAVERTPSPQTVGLGTS